MTAARRRAVPLAIDPRDPTIVGIMKLLAEHADRLRAHDELMRRADVHEPPDDDLGWVFLKDAAHATGLSRQAINDWILTGKIVGRRKGAGPWKVNLQNVKQQLLSTLHKTASKCSA